MDAIPAIRKHWFVTNPHSEGAYVLVDGQFGSTGKGLFASVIAYAGSNIINKVTTNAGPNSGHTGNVLRMENDLIMTQQVPIASAVYADIGQPVETSLNAGAVIIPQILKKEVLEHQIPSLLVHPCAAVVIPEDILEDTRTVRDIASTGKGIGPAMARKIMRRGKISPLMMSDEENAKIRYGAPQWDWRKDTVFVETAQGFSLGINSEQFYPNTTARECTAMQAIADARIPPQMVMGVAMTLRTFPIRVGNTENSSGGWYPDQREVTWNEIGQEPELTSVTKRVRRVATWSRIQFREAVAANHPDLLFLNFMNYLPPSEGDKLIDLVKEDYEAVMGYPPVCLVLGYGPRIADMRVA